MYEDDLNEQEQKIGQIVQLDETKHDFLGLISVYYDNDSGQLLFGVPSSKDEETRQFLFNLVQEMVYTVNYDGMEC